MDAYLPKTVGHIDTVIPLGSIDIKRMIAPTVSKFRRVADRKNDSLTHSHPAHQAGFLLAQGKHYRDALNHQRSPRRGYWKSKFEGTGDSNMGNFLHGQPYRPRYPHPHWSGVSRYTDSAPIVISRNPQAEHHQKIGDVVRSQVTPPIILDEVSGHYHPTEITADIIRMHCAWDSGIRLRSCLISRT